MIKFKLVAKPEIYHEIFNKLKLLLKNCAETTTDDPDFVVVVGGDGTILNAERAYPSVPKITFRSSDVGSRCMYSLGEFNTIINKVLSNEFMIMEEPKLCLENYNMIALNEIQLHNYSPISAVRFSVDVDDEVFFNSAIGDGIIIATPFGSSGYYTSVGGETFKDYIGIALNNPYNYDRKSGINLISLESIIKIRLHRRNGILIADNNPNFVETVEDEEYIIRKADKPANFIVVKL